MGWDSLVAAARQGKGPLRHARKIRHAIRGIRLPVIRPIAGGVYAGARLARMTWKLGLKVFYREPMLRYRCASVGHHLALEGPIPLILGNGRIEIGNDVRLGAPMTWDVGFDVGEAEIMIEDGVQINYRNIISSAGSVRIGQDTLIAGEVAIFDNPSHPLDPEARRAGARFSASEVRPVVIGRNVWIGLRAIILRGVTIGDNSVVAAGSVVTKSVPPNTLVAGNPARPVRNLAPDVPDTDRHQVRRDQ